MRNRIVIFVFELVRLRHKRALGVLMLVPLVTTCGRQIQQFDTGWSPAQTFPSSDRALIAKLNGVPVCIDGNDYYFLGNDGTNWTKKTFPLAVNVANARPQTDPASTRFVLHDGNAHGGNVRDGQLRAQIVCCSLDPASGITTIFDRRLTFDTEELLGDNKTPSYDAPFPEIWKQYGPPQIKPQSGRLSGGLFVGKDVYVAYTVECGSVYGSNRVVNSTGPNQAGLLFGIGDSSHWTKLKLLDAYTSWQDVFATRENLYFLASGGGSMEKIRSGLWSVRVPRKINVPTAPELVASSFARDSGKYSAVTDGETIHLAWLDNRHERYHNLRAMLTDIPAGENNWELYYRSRKDSDSAWTKEILLSKGLDFAFDPHVAVEGENIVVVWAGYPKDEKMAVPWFHPSDIYFTTSRDGGRTWKPAARLTDNAKAGTASINPQVVLHQGVIHLFYSIGQLVYQHRLFPLD